MHIDPTHSSTLLLPRNGPPPSGPFLLASPAGCGGCCVPNGSPPSDPTLARHPRSWRAAGPGRGCVTQPRGETAGCVKLVGKCDERHRKTVLRGALCVRPEAQQYPPPLKAARPPAGRFFYHEWASCALRLACAARAAGRPAADVAPVSASSGAGSHRRPGAAQGAMGVAACPGRRATSSARPAAPKPRLPRRRAPGQPHRAPGQPAPPLSDVRRRAIEDRGLHALCYLLAGEADLRVQQGGLAVGHVAVRQADAQDPHAAGGGAGVVEGLPDG